MEGIGWSFLNFLLRKKDLFSVPNLLDQQAQDFPLFLLISFFIIDYCVPCVLELVIVYIYAKKDEELWTTFWTQLLSR